MKLMKASDLPLFLVSLWTLVLLGACTPHRAFLKTGPESLSLEKRVKNPKLPASLHAIEFDEQGDFWDRRQLELAIEATKKTKKPPLVVTYVHGWRHDASDGDGDLAVFTNLIHSLQQQNSPAKDFTVIGVYVAWRGGTVKELKGKASLLTSLPAVMSFYDRRFATDRIARAPLTTTLLQLTQAARGNRKGKSILIGHSFGARVVEHAMSQAIITASALGRGANSMPADLIFLVNQASESITARQLKLALQKWPNGTAPAIISLSSATDGPNNWAWQKGLGLARLFGGGGKMRDYTSPAGDHQRTYYTRTTGQDARQVTYRLIPSGTYKNEKVAIDGDYLGEEPIRGPLMLAGKPWELRSIEASEHASFILKYDAYWVVRVPKEILHGHSGNRAENGIFNSAMTDLMSNLVGYALPKANANSKPAPAPPAQSEVDQKLKGLQLESQQLLQSINRIAPIELPSRATGRGLERP